MKERRGVEEGGGSRKGGDWLRRGGGGGGKNRGVGRKKAEKEKRNQTGLCKK